MFISKSDKVPSIVAVGARETIVVQISKPELANGMSGKVTFYRYSMADERPNTKGWKTADGFVAYTDAITIAVGANVGSSKLMGNYIFGTIAEYSGFIPNIADFKVIPGKDRGIVLLRQRPTATEYCAHVPNTGALKLIPSMDHDIKNANSRGESTYSYGCLIVQDFNRGTTDHWSTYDYVFDKWESLNANGSADTLDTSCFITSNGYSGVVTGRNEYNWIRITGEIYLDSPGAWSIWDYRDNCSGCDFGGVKGAINSATESWTKRVTYTSVGDEWVPFTWFFAEGTGGDYWAIHIQGPNDSSHRAFRQDQLRYSRDQWNICKVPEAPKLVFRLPLQSNESSAMTGQSMTTVGSPVYETVDGRTGVHLNGSSYIYTTNSTGLPSGKGGRVICAWIRADSGEIDQYFMCYGNGSANQRYGFGITADGSRKLATFRGSYEITHNFVPEFNTWYHIMLVFQGTQEKLFVNGQLIDTVEHRDVNTQLSEICIGTGSVNHNATLTGYVSDVRIYNGASGLADIRQIYKNCMRSK